MRTSLPIFSLCLVAAACGGGSTPGTDGGTDAGTAHDGGTIDTGVRDGGTATDTGVGTDAGSGADAGSGTDAGSGVDAGSGTDAGSAPVVCTGHDVSAFPTFDQSCSSDADCVVVIHQTDCCGDTHAIGIRPTEVSAFDAAEASCEAMSPACGCAAHPTVTDSGESEVTPPGIRVTCVSHGGSPGTCFTYVLTPPP